MFKRKTNNGFLAGVLIISLVAGVLFYGLKVSAGVPDDYALVMSEHTTMGTVYEARGEKIIWGEDEETEKYNEEYQEAFESFVGPDINQTKGNQYMLRGRMSGILYGGAQNRMKVVNPWKKRTGGDVYLTIYGDLQKNIYEMLLKNEYQDTGVIVLNYKTGEILTAVGDVFHSRQMLGSVMKPILYAAALESSPEIENLVYECKPVNHRFGDVVIHCNNRVSHGTVDGMINALTISCNGYAVSVARSVEEETLLSNLKRFGFDSSISLPGNNLAFTDSTYFGKEGLKSSETEKMMAAIGGANCSGSAMGTALAYSAIFNHGTAKAPYLMKETAIWSGGEKTATAKNDDIKMCSEQTAAKVIGMMKNVTEHGTGKILKDLGYETASKTGTAMYDHSTNVLWFVAGILDEEHPYLVVTYIDHAALHLSSSKDAGYIVKEALKYTLANEGKTKEEQVCED